MHTAAIPTRRLPNGPASSALAAELRRAMADGRFGGGGFIPGERELAREHSVARMTARAALKTLESEGLVAAVPGKGYRVMARANSPNLGCPVAFVISSETIPASAGYLHRRLAELIRETADARGWGFLNLIEDRARMAELFAQLGSTKTWGLVVDSAFPEVLAGAASAGLPVVAVDSWDAAAGYDAVVQDSFDGARQAAAWLADRGHRRIAWFGQTVRAFHARARFGGAAAGLAESGLSFAATITREISDTNLLGPAREMLTGPDRPTGILALWQPMAAAVAAAARELGLAAGRDFDFVGWSADETCRGGFLPSLGGGPAPAVVVWSARQMVEAALDRLAERRTRPDLPVLRLVVPTRVLTPDELAAPDSGERR